MSTPATPYAGTPEWPKVTSGLLVDSSKMAFAPDTIAFHARTKELLRITADGRLVTGEGLSADEATQQAAKLLIASFEEQIQKMVEKRIAAERERVRVLTEAAEQMLVPHIENSKGWRPDGTYAMTFRYEKIAAALAATKEGA